MQNLEKKVKSLPRDLHQEVEDYIDFLLKRRAKHSKKKLTLSWRGALRDDKNPVSSVELQHKALDWWHT